MISGSLRSRAIPNFCHGGYQTARSGNRQHGLGSRMLFKHQSRR